MANQIRFFHWVTYLIIVIGLYHNTFHSMYLLNAIVCKLSCASNDAGVLRTKYGLSFDTKHHISSENPVVGSFKIKLKLFDFTMRRSSDILSAGLSLVCSENMLAIYSLRGAPPSQICQFKKNVLCHVSKCIHFWNLNYPDNPIMASDFTLKVVFLRKS